MEQWGWVTDLLDGLQTDCIPDFLCDSGQKFLVDLAYVETLALGDIFVPLALDLCLVCQQHSLSVWA